MDWHFLGARPKLNTWAARSFSAGSEDGPQPGDCRDNHERHVGDEPSGPPLPHGPFRRLATAIFSFDVFRDVAAGVVAKAPIDVGDTVGVCYRLVPGCRIFFAARAYARFDDLDGERWRAGFSYRTLRGHPICGEETFCVEKNLATGRITVALRSWSRPVHWLTRVGYPLARRWQLQAARKALDHLQAIAAAQ